MAAMVNMNNLLNGKDSRWLQLEVCREFQRNKCSRPDTECKFAHPPANVEVQNGRVTACYDSIKGRCNREKPPCKYFHPPQHLKDQLLINGRNHLALKNALMQQMGLTPGQALVPGQVQAVATNPYLSGMPQVGSTYNPYFAPGPIMPTIVGPDPTGVASQLSVVPQTVVTQQKMPRTDRLEPAAVSPLLAPHQAAATALEIGKKRPREPSAADADLLLMDMKSVGSFYYENFPFPGMMPYKRPATDKSGVPVYQPNATTYQQLMQLQQPFVPVSCEYSTSPAPAACASPAASSIPPSDQQIPATTSVASQLSKESDNPIPVASTSTATSASAPYTVSAYTQQQQQSMVPDPAALAKEVAQQNYAKAVKFAQAQANSNYAAAVAATQSYAATLATPTYATAVPLSLNPMNYTGISLNKQALSVPPPALARYPSLPLGFGAAGLNLGLTNPYAALNQTNLLNFARPPPTFLNPYSLVRATYPTAGAAPVMNASLIGAQYQVPVSAASISNVPTSNNLSAAAAQNNNNNVVLQPYKKLKTT
ncbi:nuclear envelope pore membrane protein POM 121-like isoform X2 [Coccinella septempunctata]|uniref:nuclear envelope pore membrane protein POM 121-like isoform X2 n=1 Tax=Coccinella septempunctata TaxID=41139 RepID=UPI001D067943|nr:nuclear envelope pore membrane protein POM 121-like isoform X2 [Coccinella septempunctata]